MKHCSGFILLCLLLAILSNGCIPQIIPLTSTPTVPPTSTATALPTQTATNTATATVTPTETPEPVWLPEYTAAFTDTKEIIVSDVLPDAKDEFSKIKLFNLDLITDESFLCVSPQGEKFRRVGYNTFSTFKGEAAYHSGEAYQAVAKLIMWAIFESAVRAGYKPQQAVSPENDYEAFTQFVREMTDGKQVEVQAVVPVTADKFKQQRTTLGLPDTIKIIFVSAKNYKFNKLPQDDGGNYGWGVRNAPEENLLELYVPVTKDLYYVRSYNLSRFYSFSVWQSFGLGLSSAPSELVSKGNEYVSFATLSGALNCYK